jgi:TRAP-type C4-dicarboxylate transport system permease small subunit
MSEEAQSMMMKYLEVTAKAAGFSDPKTIPEIIGVIIAAFLSLLGIIFLILIIYGGFLWMTSAGNETKVLKAKKTLTQATIGLIIIVSSYAITYFVINALQGAALE